MLNAKATKALQRMVKFGCFIKFLPYEWDLETNRIIPAPAWHMFLFRLHHVICICMTIFSTTRFSLTFRHGADPVPDLIRTMSALWVLAYMLENVCYFQLHLKKDQVRFYANELFNFIEKNLEETSDKNEVYEVGPENNVEESQVDSLPLPGTTEVTFDPEKSTDQRDRKDWISRFVLVSLFFLVINPPSHCIMVMDTPCAPHFLGSIILPCRHADDNQASILQKIPFFIMEMYLVGNMLYLFSFNWAMIFLGLAWSKLEMKKSRDMLNKNFDSETVVCEETPQTYRFVQTLLAIVNDSFEFYLSWFPSIQLSIVALLIFGIIRFWQMGYRSYLMFPACGFRCAFESYTPLSLAGMVNKESVKLLRQWKRATRQFATSQINSEWVNSILASCEQIKCKAGSFYTFENSIVLTTLCNCSDLTTNLLVMYK